MLSIWGGARLERARWKVDARRLHEQRKEDERRDRRTAYLRYSTAYNTLDSYATGYPPTDEEALKATLHEYNHAIAALDLYGTPEVREALNEQRRATRALGAAMAPDVEAGAKLDDAFIAQWRKMRDRLIDAQTGVLTAMRQDVGPLPAEPPE
ncbi:MAG TPA: hypothetical protein VG106_10050 [Vicinamibacterales bacterium]|nr:hypothetical protein [Vicinamibacterales bacterium]